MIQEGKSLLSSRQVWLNVITAVLSVSDVLPPHIGLPLNVVGNLLLRVFFTDKPITSVLPK